LIAVWTYLWTLLASLLGTHVTYWLSHKTKFGAIRASALSTLIFAAATSDPRLQAAFFGATFVGMSDSKRIGEKKVLLASVVFSLIFTFLLTRMRSGIGGTLGASALISCLLVYAA
jgi:hypothetical protein